MMREVSHVWLKPVSPTCSGRTGQNHSEADVV